MRYSRVNLQHLRWVMLAVLVAAVGAASVTATTKGPDAGGYSGTDSTTYSFVDISGASGGISILAGTDDGTATLTIPFAFQFYGQPYSLICVSSNGALHFVASESACVGLNDFANTDLTTVATPGDHPAVLPLWSDLTFQVAGAGAVFYQTLGSAGSRRFVVQWNDAYPQGSPNPVTFQVILSEGTNAVLFQYKTVGVGPGNPASNGGQATIGVRNAGALTNQQQVAWSFGAPVIGDNTAVLFSAATADALDGRMRGAGFIASGNQHDHFVFRVSQRQEKEYGRLEYWINASRRCPLSDHAFDRDRNDDGGHDDHYGRDHRSPPSRFEATSVTDVVFSDDPAFRPSQGSGSRRPSVDSVTFKGTGNWNGRTGYTFEAQASDQGEAGRNRDTFSLVVRDALGVSVANVSGALAGGNVQSTRVRP